MTLTLAVLGDSIAFGQGASRPADTIGARLAARAGDAGIAVRVATFAVPGARSDALAAQVTRAAGSGAEVALIVIGANDLTRFVPPTVAADQLGSAVRSLVGAGTQVVVAPAPDLSAVPWVPPQLRPLVRSASVALRQAQTVSALAAGARVVDVGVSSLATFAEDLTLFSADRFHPSSAGYAVIADALWPAFRAALEDAALGGDSGQGRIAST